jgi:molybdopterin adenylyltransferase
MSISFAILTVSDRSAAGSREDLSGPALAKAVENAGWKVVEQGLVPDDFTQIADLLKRWSDSGKIEVILTSGGTGFSARDITPEATLEVIDRLAPGLAEAMRAGSLAVTPHAMLSRAVAGIRKRCLIINLPGSPKGALETFHIVQPALPHAVQLLQDEGGAEAGHRRPPVISI